MRIRLLEVDLDRNNQYKELTITDGFYHPVYEYDVKISARLSQSTYFNCTYGKQAYELFDVRNEFRSLRPNS